MNILIVSKNAQHAKNISLPLFFVMLILFLLISTLVVFSYPLIVSNSSYSNDNEAVIQLLTKQHQLIKSLEQQIKQQKSNVVLKLAQMQSHLIKLDNLGEKLVKVAKIKPAEFNFNRFDGIGGPITDKKNKTDLRSHYALSYGNAIDTDQRLTEILRELNSKSQQLYVIEALYDDKLYKNSVMPRGKPTEKGWISSFFGKRKDPFTGKNSFHKGIDIAAKLNTKIIATATGIVSWADKRSGYGNLVEINHGNGLFTRYGHCKTILVKEGQKIKQGDVIATIGSTGRSTGPHVHYEVLKNNVKINPVKYVRRKRTNNSIF